MDFFNNYVNACNSKSLDAKAIAESFDISKNTFKNWENGSIPKAEMIVNLANRVGVSTDYLLLGKEASLTPEEQQLVTNFSSLNSDNQIRVLERIKTLLEIQDEEHKNHQKQIMVNIKIADIAAGAGTSVPFTNDDAFTPRKFPPNAIPDDADCGVPINGDSMEPQYPNGCIAWVKRTNTANYGDVVIAVLNGEPYCKIYQPDGLHSYNSTYKPLHINDQDRFSVFGKVIGYYMK